jgi:hypothetical protein
MLYCPEMGEKPEPRVFHSEYNYRDSYSVFWKVEDDACARAVFKKLRIRPAFGTTIELKKQGDYDVATRAGSDMYGCLITYGSHSKLRDADVIAIKSLLD